MNQTQKRNLIINQEWKEADSSLVPYTNRLPQPKRDPNYRPATKPRTGDPARVATLANRMLCELTGNIMDHVELLDGYGRIAVVKFYPMQRVDPIMAVPLVPFDGMSGWLHKLAFRDMTQLLMNLENNWMPVNTTRWYRAARRNGRAMIKHSQKFLTPNEWQFYIEQVTETYTNPLRREWRAGGVR